MDEMPDEHDVLRDTLDDAFGDDPTRRSVAQAALTRLADELKGLLMEVEGG